MNVVKHRITLDVFRSYDQCTIYTKQGDNNRELIVTLTAGSRPYPLDKNATYIFSAKLPDGSIYYVDRGTAWTDDGTVHIKLQNGITNDVGIIPCELKIYGTAGELLTSPRFTVIVQSCVYTDDLIIEQNNDKVQALTELIAEAKRTVAWMARKDSPKRNSELATRQMLSVARSYYDARGTKENPTFRYGYNTCLSTTYDGGNEIDCSTYIGLVLRGIAYQDSAYSGATPITPPVIDPDYGNDDGNGEMGSDDADTSGNYDPSIWKSNDKYSWTVNPADYLRKVKTDDPETPVRTASQLCEWMEDLGMTIDISDGKFNNVMPGDIIFWAKSDDGEWRQPNRYKHISHVAMCRSVAEATEADGIPGYPYKHTMLEVTTVSPYVLNRTLEKIRPDQVVSVCRPDLGAMNGMKHGAAASGFGYESVDDMMDDGLFYLSSEIAAGLPEGVANGIHKAILCMSTYNSLGKAMNKMQLLMDTVTGGVWYRAMYLYSTPAAPTAWNEWHKLSELELDNTLRKYGYAADAGAVGTRIDNAITPINAVLNSIGAQVHSMSERMELLYEKPEDGIPEGDLDPELRSLIHAGGNGIESVNGKTGKRISLVPADLGTLKESEIRDLIAWNIMHNQLYSFPDGGIPETDLSEDVRTKLNSGGGGGGAVASVNGKVGAVVLTAADVGALPSTTTIPTDKHIRDLIDSELSARVGSVDAEIGGILSIQDDIMGVL